MLAIVLMDIMMPEMDGYETMQVIAKNRRSAGCRSSPDSEGDEGRPREVPGCGRFRLPCQACEYRSNYCLLLRTWLHR